MGKLSYGDALHALRQNRRRVRAQRWLDEHRQELSIAFGDHYAGARTDWKAVTEALAITTEITSRAGERVPERLIEVLCGGHGGSQALRPYCAALDSALRQADVALAELNRLLVTENVALDGIGLSDASIQAYVDWLSRWVDGLSPLWSAAEAMNECREIRTTSVATLVAETREALALQTIQEQLGAASAELRRQFGHLYEGVDTRWEIVLQTLSWAGRVLEQFGGPPPESFIQCLQTLERPETSVSRQNLVTGISAVGEAIEELRPRFTSEGYKIGRTSLEEAALFDLAAWAEAKREALPRLVEWIDLNLALARADEAGLSTFVQEVAREQLAVHTWRDAFLRQICTLWLTWRYEQSPQLAQFRGQHHEAKIEEFRRLDRLQWPAAAARIAERLVQKRPSAGLGMHAKSEPAILLREAGNRKTEALPPLAQALCSTADTVACLKAVPADEPAICGAVSGRVGDDVRRDCLR